MLAPPPYGAGAGAGGRRGSMLEISDEISEAEISRIRAKLGVRRRSSAAPGVGGRLLPPAVGGRRGSMR